MTAMSGRSRASRDSRVVCIFYRSCCATPTSWRWRTGSRCGCRLSITSSWTPSGRSSASTDRSLRESVYCTARSSGRCPTTSSDTRSRDLRCRSPAGWAASLRRRCAAGCASSAKRAGSKRTRPSACGRDGRPAPCTGAGPGGWRCSAIVLPARRATAGVFENLSVARVPALTTRRLEPTTEWRWPSLRDAWTSRELLFFFVWRDVTVRYKQMALGAAWAVIQPLATMIVFSIFFGRFAHMPSDGVPYPLFAMCGLVPWTYFSAALANGSQSLVAQQHILSKVYFPRVLVPLASVAAPLVDFSVALAIVLALAAGYRVTPSTSV